MSQERIHEDLNVTSTKETTQDEPAVVIKTTDTLLFVTKTTFVITTKVICIASSRDDWDNRIHNNYENNNVTNNDIAALFNVANNDISAYSAFFVT